MIFYNLKVFPKDWLIVFYDNNKHNYQSITNDIPALQSFYNSYKKEIWAGYNSRLYGQYIIKAILAKLNPWNIHTYMKNKGVGFKYHKSLNYYPIINYDVMQGLDKDLKLVEGFMGNDINDTSLSSSSSLSRNLSEKEMKKEEELCKYDLSNIIEIFHKQYSQFNAMMTLVKQFDLPLGDIGKTESNITSKILGCEFTERNDEFDFIIEDYNKIEKYTSVMDFYQHMQGKKTSSFYQQNMQLMVAGVLHKFGWGGVHGAKERCSFKSNQGKQCWHIDVTSYYPSYLIAHNRISRSSKYPEKYVWAYNYQISLKKEGKKKERLPFKKMLNALSGAMKDKNNAAYDPCMNNTMVVNCQLSTLMLLEQLEKMQGFELIQSNTDGLIVSIPDNQSSFDEMKKICNEWESKCSTEKASILLDFEQIDWLIQKDVNNYIFQFCDSDVIERKGAYIKELSDLDNNLPIVNTALVNYFTNNIPIEDTILNCEDLKQFQFVKNISEKFEYISYNGKPISEKCIRVFASKRESDGGLSKFQIDTQKSMKLEATPFHCFLNNGDISNVKAPWFLDKEWYVQMANDRLMSFGVQLN